MARDIRELARRLRILRDNIPSIFSEVATITAVSGKALAERTIRNQGFGATYKNPDYIEIRREKGLEVDWVTLAFTNVMWGGMVPSEVQINGTIYLAYLTHTNEEGKYKMSENYKRYGNFINIALRIDDNESKMHEVVGFELNRILNKYINE